MTRKQRKMLIRVAICFASILVLLLSGVEGWLGFALWIAVYLIIGYDILWRAATGIFSGQIFDENFLMAVATIGAIVLAIMGRGDLLEAVAVMLFYQIGELFQSYAIGKSRRSISKLMDIRPDHANLELDGKITAVSPDSVEIGGEIIVLTGEKIPIDGIVTDGEASLDTFALTGESVPRHVGLGDEVLSGCINTNGVLKIQTTKAFGESAVSKILELVENASANKSRSENFITKFAKFYTPAVCLCALLLAVLPPTVISLAGGDAMWSEWLYRALTFLVISCPCALVISIPLSFFSGLGGASRRGILIKGSGFIETLSQVDCVALDKTGTLTKGSFAVREMHSSVISDERLIEYAALAECASSHPIAKSLVSAYGKLPEHNRVTEIQEIRGRGVSAFVDKKEVLVGNDALMNERGIACGKISTAATVVHVALDGEYVGYILISDEIKQSARKSLESLRKVGVKRIVVLTGDTQGVATEVGEQVGADETYAQLLPDKKVEILESLIKSGYKTAFMGDGINDAPVLARADVGVAMGAIGSDAAIEAADAVIMDDDPQGLATAIGISKKCMRIVYQNIVLTMLVKGVCLILGALGIANMWLAIFADVGVMVLAVLNAIRALFVKKI